jgi:hypothetical protein
MAKTSSPDFKSLMTASMAAMPLAKARPYFAFSREAKLFSKTVRVGFWDLPYS